ncbi:hypothetical protein BaRGS_00027831 [Batillaria attramentaria]|uniref:Ig-like domain-containing protein n=1 Tax=Batillaria attramentaria TaxID=370345 RepID=A0ABD0K0M8_9CAEN
MTSLQTLFILIHIGLCDVRADFILDPEAFKLTEVIQKANETKEEAEITVKFQGGVRRVYMNDGNSRVQIERNLFFGRGQVQFIHRNTSEAMVTFVPQQYPFLEVTLRLSINYSYVNRRENISNIEFRVQPGLNINYTEGEDVDINVTTKYLNYKITNWVTGLLRKEVEGSGTTFSDTYYWQLSHDALKKVSQTSTSRHFKLKTTGGPQGLIGLDCRANAPTRNAFVKRLMIGTYLTHYPSANTSFFSGSIGFLDTGRSWQNVECTENSDCWINCNAVGNEPMNITLSRQDQNGIWVYVPQQIVNRLLGVLIAARVKAAEAGRYLCVAASKENIINTTITVSFTQI